MKMHTNITIVIMQSCVSVFMMGANRIDSSDEVRVEHGKERPTISPKV